MRYLLFDADETIWDFHATEEIGLRKVFSSFGIDYSEEMIAFYEEGNILCWGEYENGSLELDDLEVKRWKLFFDHIGRKEDAGDAAALFRNVLAHNGKLLCGAEEFLESIRQYPKSIVTNGISSIQRQRHKDTGTERFFENIFISSELGPHKPQKELFDMVLGILGRDRSECVMIGDSEKSDIQGAVNAGIDSIYINFSGKKSGKATWSVSSYRELEDLIRRI